TYSAFSDTGPEILSGIGERREERSGHSSSRKPTRSDPSLNPVVAGDRAGRRRGGCFSRRRPLRRPIHAWTSFGRRRTRELDRSGGGVESSRTTKQGGIVGLEDSIHPTPDPPNLPGKGGSGSIASLPLDGIAPGRHSTTARWSLPLPEVYNVK